MSVFKEYPAIVAEIGCNHAGDLELAKRMVLAAMDAGTPYVKFQTYVTERLLRRDDPEFELCVKEMLSNGAFRELKRFCDEKGAVFFSTPFDPDSADLLEELNVPVYKIASSDMTYIPFLRHVARKGRPIVLSTGASSVDVIDRAVDTIRSETEAELILLHCTAAYPCPDGEANLAVIPMLAERYGCPVGFSDHTAGFEVALGAVALGAVLVEKHFTIHRSLPGGDNGMSINPDELRCLTAGAKRVYTAIGSSKRELTATEKELVTLFYRSLVARRDLPAGEVLQEEDLDAVRPGTGLSPEHIEQVVGKTLVRAISRGEQITLDVVR